VAVASAGPYASLHLAPDRQPCQHTTAQFFTGWMPFLPPNQQSKSTDGTEQQYNEKNHNINCPEQNLSEAISTCTFSDPLNNGLAVVDTIS